MDKIIEFVNVSKTYNNGTNETLILNNINFSINKGEFVVILGPSGAGKSTLLNLIGGIDNVTSGNLIVDHRDISKYNEEQLTKYRAADIGFIFQSYNILPALTVEENVSLVKDINKNSIDAKEIIDKVGLKEHYNKFPSQLSGGEQQRVSIARAIAKKPTLLLCDEPTGALDTKTGVEILKLLKEHCTEDNNTVVLVTHNNLIASLADRIIILKNGCVVSNIINMNPKAIDEIEW